MTSEAGEVRWGVDGAVTTLLASGETTGEWLGMVRERARRNEGIPLHRHSGDNEAFYILAGELTFWIGDRKPSSASAGTFVHIPAGTPHSFRVDSHLAEYLIITTPRHERFYRAISDPAVDSSMPPERELDMERVEAACAEFDVEILGPPPGRS